MLIVEKTIEKFNLFNEGETIGVACSGGIDSMCLLHFLNQKKKEYKIKVVAINVNHSIRENSEEDSKFVENFCKSNNIKLYSTTVECLKMAKSSKESSLEEVARNARYEYFEALLNQNYVDKIALAHHQKDQVETILLNIFRGSGLQGASGMSVIRDKYIRPFLLADKKLIEEYAKEKNISFVIDETNENSDYSRNFIRNEVLPLLKEKWNQIETNIINFGRICKEDNEFINSQINLDSIIFSNNTCRIPMGYFNYKSSIINRIIRSSMEKIGITKDIETKHINLIKNLAKDGQNGAKISLPKDVTVSREYDFITIQIKKSKEKLIPFEFDLGTFNVPNFGNIIIKSTTKKDIVKGKLKIDLNKLPGDCVWRNREEGDMFTPYGGKNKKLKEYLIDKKVPSRVRTSLPVLASGKEIYIVGNIEISDKIKIDDNTKKMCALSFELLD